MITIHISQIGRMIDDTYSGPDSNQYSWTSRSQKKDLRETQIWQ